MATKEYAAAGPWISVKTRLPEVGKAVLVRVNDCGEMHPEMSMFMGNYWWAVTCEVTHWAEVNVYAVSDNQGQG